jgi:hypothetical protein
VTDLYSETGIGHLLFEQAEAIRALEGADEQRARFDEGIVAMEYTLSRLPNANVAAVPVMLVMKMAGDIVTYANVGLRSEWIGRALEEVGR